MSDKPFDDSETAPEVEELKELLQEGDPEFTKLVKNGLNRSLLVGDSLEFSLDVFQKTLWEYLKSAFEMWPSKQDDKSE